MSSFLADAAELAYNLAVGFKEHDVEDPKEGSEEFAVMHIAPVRQLVHDQGGSRLRCDADVSFITAATRPFDEPLLSHAAIYTQPASTVYIL